MLLRIGTSLPTLPPGTVFLKKTGFQPSTSPSASYIIPTMVTINIINLPHKIHPNPPHNCRQFIEPFDFIRDLAVEDPGDSPVIMAK